MPNSVGICRVRMNPASNAHRDNESIMRGYHIYIRLHNTTSTPPFIPVSLFQHLPAQESKPTVRRNVIVNPKDYRFGPIQLDWVDFDDMRGTYNTGAGPSRKKDGRDPATATFIPHTKSKYGSTNLPEGTVHVFRDSAVQPTLPTEEFELSSLEKRPDAGGVTLGVLAVPSWMNPSDFLAFVAPAADSIAHLRIIRDSSPNRSIVVIQFNHAADAAEFAEAYNGKPFNSMEPEICHVVRVLSVNIDTDGSSSTIVSRLGFVQGTVYELPTCPVCLERMDSAVTGLITVPCSHTFHCMCLSKWGDSRCPVCRYSQTLLTSHPTSSSTSRSNIPFANPSSPPLSTCSSCSSTTNLWICLICGNVGCGRYGRAHAHAHYDSTTHLYALELETQRVWDYAGDGYVHRLIQNKADGKLVELPSAASSMGGGTGGREGLGPGPQDALSAEKIEAIGIEYSYLLTSQLDSQRSYYEEQTTGLKGQIEELTCLVERSSKEFEREKCEMRENEMRRGEEQSARIAEVERDKIKAEKRAERAGELVRRLDRELSEEKAVSEGLMKNLEKMKGRVEAADTERADFTVKIAELEDQLRDIMFFLEAKKTIESGEGVEAEAAGGSIEVPKITNKKKKKK